MTVGPVITTSGVREATETGTPPDSTNPSGHQWLKTKKRATASSRQRRYLHAA